MRTRLIALALVLVAAPVHAQEKVTLADPVHVDPGATEFRLMTLSLDAHLFDVHAVLGEVMPGTTVFIVNGKTLDCHYTGTEAEVVLQSLNTMNFSNTSMQKRVLQQCQKDGKIGAGTISGTPSAPGSPSELSLALPPPTLKSGGLVVPPVPKKPGGW